MRRGLPSAGRTPKRSLTAEPDEGGQSDPPIVVRDGRTDHTAKGRAVSQSGHSTHARETNAPTRSVSSTLSALARKAKKDKKHRFKSLYRLIDLQMLYESFSAV